MKHGDMSNCSHWNDEETKCLINIWKDPDIFAEVKDVNSKHKTVYKRIARRIGAAGHIRDENQVRNKIRMLTNNYKRLLKVKDSFDGTGTGKNTALHFAELHQLFVENGDGILDDEGETSAPGLHPRCSPSSSAASDTPALHHQFGLSRLRGVPATTSSDRGRRSLSNEYRDHGVTGKDSGFSDGMCNGAVAGSSEEDIEIEGTSQEMQSCQMSDTGWIVSDDDDIDEPRTKMKCKADLRLHPNNSKRERARNPKKDETLKHIVHTLMENNIRRDKIFMEAEDAHRRMEAERHSEEIRLLRDQIQLERDKLQFEREERDRIELIRREEAARNERFRREEMERTEKVRLDERDREERRFALMMALIKSAQNNSK